MLKKQHIELKGNKSLLDAVKKNLAGQVLKKQSKKLKENLELLLLTNLQIEQKPAKDKQFQKSKICHQSKS